MDDVTQRSAIEQARLIRERELGAVELLEIYLERIAERDGQLNAFVALFEDWARRDARRVDGKRSDWPDPLPTFWGVPFAIKDNDAMKWTFTRVGSRAFRWLWTPFDSAAVRRLRAAGFVMVGKTSTSEFALLPVVAPDIHPPTRNPWEERHSAGGSSGGAAAAVAAKMLPVAHGADGGGSIRIPASCCGLFGFKASWGVMPPFYAPLESVGLAVAGALARTVDDSAAVLDALCGRPASSPDSWLKQSRERPPDGLRVRFTTQSEFAAVDPEIAEAVVRVAAILESMGHHVEEGERLEGSLEEFLPVYGRLAANVPVLSERLVQPVTRWLRAIGREHSRADASALNAQIAERLLGWFGEADLWVLPSIGRFPPKVDEFDGLPPGEEFHASAELGAFTAPFNITGQPAASLPVGRNCDGLPYGVQIVGRRGADALVFQVARALRGADVWTAP